MRFTYQTLAVFLSTLLFNGASAHGHRCERDIAWQDPVNCHFFFECVPGVEPVRKQCGPGTAFNPVVRSCDYEQNVASCWKKPHPHHH
ncbi:chitin binding Peritrophin-A domain protein [Aspergillus ellipticus CBS 707.79]|uniref:Chitin binding Peritrophin-A domain protein n=1 Tax=Aspergillus ellipticus CBS 707.79 TaxID=1448320 RepID=A0A319F1F5_9EURO|nr:chitin binding Peritrophin-A domain protein [Aspergillus ellipticus CBS 707.79]